MRPLLQAQVDSGMRRPHLRGVVEQHGGDDLPRVVAADPEGQGDGRAGQEGGVQGERLHCRIEQAVVGVHDRGKQRVCDKLGGVEVGRAGQVGRGAVSRDATTGPARRTRALSRPATDAVASSKSGCAASAARPKAKMCGCWKATRKLVSGAAPWLLKVTVALWTSPERSESLGVMDVWMTSRGIAAVTISESAGSISASAPAPGCPADEKTCRPRMTPLSR